MEIKTRKEISSEVTVSTPFRRRPSEQKRWSNFTNSQIFELEKRFLYQKYLSRDERIDLAQTLGLTEQAVTIWFERRRIRLKIDWARARMEMDAYFGPELDTAD